jgi:8-oxo-dGTP pyrophosphatase MutT (NUDIX family)
MGEPAGLTPFPRRLPDSRLGVRHGSLAEFTEAVSPYVSTKSLEFTLVVVTEGPTPVTEEEKQEEEEEVGEKTRAGSPPSPVSPQGRRRVLLGMKNRGFGKGLNISFGGKFLDEDETPVQCACRELQEETNIRIEPDEMERGRVGIQRFTSENDPVVMIVHVFHVDLAKIAREYCVVGCDEITPRWYDDVSELPLDNMFADDSLWLTTLLSSEVPLEINGSYHFQENCQETNTILHYHMDVRPKRSVPASYSLEQRLFHALHDNRVHSPSIKEFKECYAFCDGVRKVFAKHGRKNGGKGGGRTGGHDRAPFDVVIDVAGGHGALGALFLTCTPARRAVVIDPADVGKDRVRKAWADLIGRDKTLTYRRECLRTGLPDELEKAFTVTTRGRVLVVACHACQHLSEEVLDIACRYGVHCAVMPCCQKDGSEGATWKAASKNLSVPIAPLMDLLQCGKVMALGTHDVRMKCIDPKITPQNRIIVCRALLEDDLDALDDRRRAVVDRAHSRLELVYRRAHGGPPSKKKKKGYSLPTLRDFLPPPSLCYVAVGFVAGAMMMAGAFRRR